MSEFLDELNTPFGRIESSILAYEEVTLPNGKLFRAIHTSFVIRTEEHYGAQAVLEDMLKVALMAYSKEASQETLFWRHKPELDVDSGFLRLYARFSLVPAVTFEWLTKGAA